jgi:predicted lipid-binding transport protein (Tim44 family)
MPVTTRRKRNTAAAKSSASPAGASKPAAAPKRAPKTKSGPSGADGTKPAKKQKGKAANGDYKDTFNHVVEEISQNGVDIVKTALTHHVPTSSKIQDPEKLSKRQAIASEFRKYSLTSDHVNPAEVKTKVVQNKKKQELQAKNNQKKVVEHIETLGDKGVHKLLHRIKGSDKVAGKVAKKGAAPAKKLDIKKIQKKTLTELTDLVTPTSVHKPSVIKTKVDIKETKKQIGAEVVKYATMKEIKSLGADGVKKVVSKN